MSANGENNNFFFCCRFRMKITKNKIDNDSTCYDYDVSGFRPIL